MMMTYMDEAIPLVPSFNCFLGHQEGEIKGYILRPDGHITADIIMHIMKFCHINIDTILFFVHFDSYTIKPIGSFDVCATKSRNVRNEIIAW